MNPPSPTASPLALPTDIPGGPVRIGLIGCGNFARHIHVPNLIRSPLVDLVTVADLDAVRAGEVARFAEARPTTSAQEVLSDPAVEAVLIAVRDAEQTPLVEAALEAGKDVYVEKPAGTDPRQLRRLHDRATALGRIVQVGMQKRFAPLYQRAKVLLDADGGVSNLFLRMVDDAWRWATGYAPGSLLAHDVCHHFDLAACFTGAPIQRVYAQRARPDDDAILLTMENGAVVTIICSGHGTMDMPKERLEGVSRRGGVVVNDFVELHAYGYPGEPFRETCPLVLSPKVREWLGDEPLPEGAEGLARIRRAAWLARQPSATGEDPSLAPNPLSLLIPNFLREQGWLPSVETFCRQVRGVKDLETPNLLSAACALEAAHAAYRSLESGLAERPGEG